MDRTARFTFEDDEHTIEITIRKRPKTRPAPQLHQARKLKIDRPLKLHIPTHNPIGGTNERH